MATKNLLVRIGADLSGLAEATDKARGHFAKLEQVRKSAMDNRQDALQGELVKAQQQVQKLEADFRRMTDGLGQAGTENSLMKQLRDVQKARAELDKQYADKGGGLKDSVPESVMQQYEVLNRRADALYDKIKQVRLDPAATPEAQALAEKLGLARENAARLQTELDGAKQEQAAYKPNIKGLSLDALQAAGSRIAGVFGGIATAAGRTASAVKGLAGKAGEWLTGLAKRATDAVSGISDGLGRVARRITSLAASALVFNVMSKGFQELQKGIAGVVESDSQLKASLSAMQGSLLTAFAPLWQTILPMVRAAAAALANLAAMIAQVMATLFGTSVGAAQKSAAAYYKQASAAGASAGASKKAAEEAAKANRQAADFDILHKLGSTDSESGGGGGASVTMPDFSAAVKPSDFVQSLTDAIQAGDWTGVGRLFAEKLNETLAGIPWETIQATVQRWATNIADLLTGFARGLDWTLTGNAFGNGINTALGFVDTFVQKFDWAGLGILLGNGLEAMRQAVDWELLGRFMTDKFRAAFELLHGFVTSGFDWRGLGDNAAAAINAAWRNIDWAQAAVDLGKLIADILGFASQTIQGVDWGQIGTDVGGALRDIDWGSVIGGVFELIGSVVGGVLGAGFGFFTGLFDGLGETMNHYFGNVGTDTADGFFMGLGEMLLDIGGWIVEHLVTPLLDGVKGALGIHSPSRVMNDLGVYTAEGFLNGLRTKWAEIVAFWAESLGNMLQKVSNWADSAGREISGWASSARSQMQTWCSTAQRAFADFAATGKAKVSEAVSSIRDNLMPLVGEAAGWGSDFVANFAAGISSRISGLLATVSSMASSVRSYLHFTVPDRGPLADADTWMPDFMQLLTQGVEQNSAPLIERVQNVARQIDRAYNTMSPAPAVALQGRVSLAADPLGRMDDGTGDIIATLRSGFAAVQRAVENKDGSVYLDGNKVEDGTAKARRKYARLYGRDV